MGFIWKRIFPGACSSPVAVEYGWDRNTFLSQTSIKAVLARMTAGGNQYLHVQRSCISGIDFGKNLLLYAIKRR